MMDEKFTRFGDLISHIAASMGELRVEVNQIKSKLSDGDIPL